VLGGSIKKPANCWAITQQAIDLSAKAARNKIHP
jgi:hypothetical protein